MPENNQSSGFFTVVNNTLGTLAKAAESYHDVRAARDEVTVSPMPATPTPRDTTPGTTSPEAAAAENGDRGPVSTMGMSTQTMILIGVAAVAGVALVTVLARKK